MTMARRFILRVPAVKTLAQPLINEIDALRRRLGFLADGQTKIEQQLSQLETQVQVLTAHLNEEVERIATDYDANIARGVQQEGEVAMLRASVLAFAQTLTRLLAQSAGASDVAAVPAVAELMQQWHALASLTERGVLIDPVSADQDNLAPNRLTALRTLFEHLAHQYVDSVEQRGQLEVRVNALTAALLQARGSSGDHLPPC